MISLHVQTLASVLFLWLRVVLGLLLDLSQCLESVGLWLKSLLFASLNRTLSG